MKSSHVDHSQESRLRIVFSDTVISFGLAADATFADIAWTLGEFSIPRHGHPLAIDITLNQASPDPDKRPSTSTAFRRFQMVRSLVDA